MYATADMSQKKMAELTYLAKQMERWSAFRHGFLKFTFMESRTFWMKFVLCITQLKRNCKNSTKVYNTPIIPEGELKRFRKDLTIYMHEYVQCAASSTIYASIHDRCFNNKHVNPKTEKSFHKCFVVCTQYYINILFALIPSWAQTS